MRFRGNLIRLSTFLGGLYFVLYFLLPTRALDHLGITGVHEDISYGFIAIGSAALGIGLINLFIYHTQKILRAHKDRPYSVLVLVSCVVMISISMVNWINELGQSKTGKEIELLSKFARIVGEDFQSKRDGVPDIAVRQNALRDAVRRVSSKLEREATQWTDESTHNNFLSILRETDKLAEQIAIDNVEVNDRLSVSLASLESIYSQGSRLSIRTSRIKRSYDLMMDGLFNPLGAAMFSLLGFYIASAAHRAFRIRNLESGLMLASAIIVMLGQIPFGMWLSHHLPEIRLWLLQWPNGAAFRAISIGASLAGLVLSLRMWLSLDSSDGGGK